MSWAALDMYKKQFAPSVEISRIFIRKFVGSMQTVAKWTHLEAILDLEAFKSMHKNSWKTRNLRKSTKILDEYPTKMHENSRFEHIQVTLCKKSWFSCPERFWPRSGNTLHQASKFRGFLSENWSDPCKLSQNERIWKSFTTWKRLKACTKTVISLYFLVNLRDVGTLFQSNARPWTAKAIAFWCLLARQAMGFLFCNCETNLWFFLLILRGF